ncbi:MAG: translation initiation factor IF-3 [Holosporales bacterium]|nr:translation initiation factor IF-3 [Holosporales bacterium]
MAKSVTNKRQDSLKINKKINSTEVRLIGADGEPVGIIPTSEALDMAYAAGLDLVMVAEDATPPVCRILDYGKYKYEQQRKKAESRKKQKIVALKEVQIRPCIGENDLLIKCKAIKKFIESGDKVKLVIRFRGREMNRKESGQEIVRKILDYCQEFAKEENPSKLEGATLMTVLTKK